MEGIDGWERRIGRWRRKGMIGRKGTEEEKEERRRERREEYSIRYK